MSTAEFETRLTVLYEEPFWIGVSERIENGKLTVAKHTFGAEPSMAEIYEFVLDHSYDLKYSPPVDADMKREHTNPKRRQREARKMVTQKGIGTKSQQALQMQREENKIERKQISKEQKEADKRTKVVWRPGNRRRSHDECHAYHDRHIPWNNDIESDDYGNKHGKFHGNELHIRIS